eukprot:gene27187-33465_t
METEGTVEAEGVATSPKAESAGAEMAEGKPQDEQGVADPGDAHVPSAPQPEATEADKAEAKPPCEEEQRGILEVVFIRSTLVDSVLSLTILPVALPSPPVCLLCPPPVSPVDVL